MFTRLNRICPGEYLLPEKYNTECYFIFFNGEVLAPEEDYNIAGRRLKTTPPRYPGVVGDVVYLWQGPEIPVEPVRTRKAKDNEAKD